MQSDDRPRSNRDRTRATRAALREAARELFARQGFAATSTPQIVAAAGMTRGALYHHFSDKLDLFRAVLEAEADAVAIRIQAGAADSGSALASLHQGAEAYFAAMSEPGRTRLLLVEGPAVLGAAAMEEIDRRAGQARLHHGLANAAGESLPAPVLAATTELLSAAFDRAALAIADGHPAAPYKAALRAVLSGLFEHPHGIAREPSP